VTEATAEASSDTTILKDWAALEHRLGVLPLIAAFFTPEGVLAEVVAGRKRGALGLFTPAPEPGWGAVALAGERSGTVPNSALLRGTVRLPGALADGALVLVKLEGEQRLAWLDHPAPGVLDFRGAGGDGLCWLHVEGAWVGPERLSRPVTLDPGGALARCLETYAAGWAAAAVGCARDGVRELRRAARTAGFHTAQQVALGITEVEIEADLAAAALRRAGEDSREGRGALLLAVAAARALSGVAARTAELRDAWGLEIDGPLANGAAATLTAYLGGSLLLERELSRALGIPETNREPGR
jgi:hypothetical protein